MTMKENRPIRLEYCNKLEKKRRRRSIFSLYISPSLLFFLLLIYFTIFPSPIRYIIDRIGSDRSIDVNSHLFSTTTTIRYDMTTTTQHKFIKELLNLL